MGSYPFPPDKKKPAVIGKQDWVSLVYGKGDHIDSTPMYISTDKLYFCEYTVTPGNYFDPPGVHTGDECYYCLEGAATIFDPVNGDVIEMEEGDALLIPKGTWHIGFNFGEKPFRVITLVAPSIWSDSDEGMGLDIRFDRKPKYYKGEE